MPEDAKSGELNAREIKFQTRRTAVDAQDGFVDAQGGRMSLAHKEVNIVAVCVRVGANGAKVVITVPKGICAVRAQKRTPVARFYVLTFCFCVVSRWWQLPDELVSTVLCTLEPTNFLTAAQVCKAFQRLCMEPSKDTTYWKCHATSLMSGKWATLFAPLKNRPWINIYRIFRRQIAQKGFPKLVDCNVYTMNRMYSWSVLVHHGDDGGSLSYMSESTMFIMGFEEETTIEADFDDFHLGTDFFVPDDPWLELPFRLRGKLQLSMIIQRSGLGHDSVDRVAQFMNLTISFNEMTTYHDLISDSLEYDNEQVGWSIRGYRKFLEFPFDRRITAVIELEVSDVHDRDQPNARFYIERIRVRLFHFSRVSGLARGFSLESLYMILESKAVDWA